MIKPRCPVLHALEEEKHTTLQRTLTILNLIKLYAKQGLERLWCLCKQSFKKYFSKTLKCSGKLLKCAQAIFIDIPPWHLSMVWGHVLVLVVGVMAMTAQSVFPGPHGRNPALVTYTYDMLFRAWCFLNVAWYQNHQESFFKIPHCRLHHGVSNSADLGKEIGI